MGSLFMLDSRNWVLLFFSFLGGIGLILLLRVLLLGGSCSFFPMEFCPVASGGFFWRFLFSLPFSRKDNQNSATTNCSVWFFSP